MAPLAAQLLGWRPQDFWRSTPDEFALFLKSPGSADENVGVSSADLKRLMENDNNG